GWMSERRRTPDALIAAVVVLCLALATLGVYMGGYFALSVLRGPPSHDILVRDFPHRWQAEINIPLVKPESLVRGPIGPSWMAEP
ncbi:MAG: hypothetical protein K8R36_07785, partial [Planctomycetales bacterium]|nr:hypothetical protein [Planctomycetales bacterium]